MNWLSLTPAEITAVFALAAAAAVWLYLLHQRPRPKRVSTLRFWHSMEANVDPRRRRRIREPWALLAQLLFLLLVILALANPRRPGWFPADQSVVLLVDMSVWSQVAPPGERPWAEQIREQAVQFLNRLPNDSEVLLLRLDADATPVVPFTKDRAVLRRAIAALRPTDTTADLLRALQLADSAAAGKSRAVIAYFGPGMMDDVQLRRLDDFRQALHQRDTTRRGGRPQLLVRLVGRKTPVENRGITRLALRRDPAQPDRWHLLTQVKNYGQQPAVADLRVSISGHVVEEQKLSLQPGETSGAHAEFAWAEGGLLQAEIGPNDALAADNRAVAYLPMFRPVRVAVVSSEPGVLRPVLAANPYVHAEFVAPRETPRLQPEITIYDGVPPPAGLSSNQILFLPGSATQETRVTAWNLQHPVTRWIRTRDISVRSSAELAPTAADAVLAWADRRPLMLAREAGGHKQLLLGFDLRHSNFPLQPAFPLLLAAAIEWMTAPVEELADSVPSGEAHIARAATHIYSPNGAEVPFAQSDGAHLLALHTGLYRVQTREGESKIAVNLSPLPARRWELDDDESDGVEAPPLLPHPPQSLWRWLVLFAFLPLWLEWILFYRSGRQQVSPAAAPAANPVPAGKGGRP